MQEHRLAQTMGTGQALKGERAVRPSPVEAAAPPARSARWRSVGVEVLILGAAISSYFLVRGLISGRISLAFDNADRVVALERSLGLFVEADLQAAIGDQGWLIDAVNWIYIYAHWPVVIATLVWLLVKHRSQYATFRNAILISGGIGLVIFALFPVAPPRFLVDYGFVDTVTQQSQSYRVLQPPAFTNKFAAVPSLHFGWNLLMGIAWATLATNRWARLFGWIMPPAMLAAIVLTANHYIVDGIAGGTLALLGYVVATRWLRRRRSLEVVEPTGLVGQDAHTRRIPAQRVSDEVA